MSTKQTVIFTFMIIFLASFLFSLGAWFHFSSELDAKERVIDSLKGKKSSLEVELNGNNSRIGEIKKNKDPIDGLEVRATAAATNASRMKGTEDGEGSEHRRVLFEQKQGEIDGKMGEGKPPAAKWKSLYEEWAKLNGDINEAVKKLKAQSVERDTKSVEAQAELDREQNTEVVEKKKIVEERKKFADELGNLRRDQEAVMDKITEVTRETRKTDKIVSQGKLIHADDDMKIVTIDKGRDQGIKRGMLFTVYSGSHASLVKKALIQITTVNATSADAVLVPANRINVQDPITGWVPSDPKMKYSIYTAGGQDEMSSVELIKPKTRADRIETYRLEKLEREGGKEAVEKYRSEREAPSAPPVELGKGFVPLMAGDWVHNPEFVPIIPETAFQKKTVDELMNMQDVNLSALTFHITDSVRPYRKEFLRRLAERNRCKVSDAMTADVNYVVTVSDATSEDLVSRKLEASKGKEEVPAEIKNLRKTLEALQEGKKIGVHVIAEDKMEEFFLQRNRKTELLRGKAIQPGRSTFYVAGNTKERSVDQTRMFIRDHGGVPLTELDEKVDYVVVGSGLDQAFFDKVKKLGLKILREDEMVHFFGLDGKADK